MQERAQLPCGILLHRRQRVRVDPERHLNPLVPQPLLDNMGRHSSLKQERRAGVSQPMERDPSYAGGLQHSVEFALTEFVGMERQAERFLAPVKVAPFLRKHQTKVVVGGAVPHLQFCLGFFVRPKERYGALGKIKSPWCAILDGATLRGAAGCRQLTQDRNGSTLQVEIGPLQAAQLVFPRARVERQGEQCAKLRAGGRCGEQEPSSLISLPGILRHVLMTPFPLGFADHEGGHVPSHEPLDARRLERAVQDRMVLRQR